MVGYYILVRQNVLYHIVQRTVELGEFESLIMFKRLSKDLDTGMGVDQGKI